MPLGVFSDFKIPDKTPSNILYDLTEKSPSKDCFCRCFLLALALKTKQQKSKRSSVPQPFPYLDDSTI